MNHYSSDCIENMDETPVWFNNIHNKTVHLNMVTKERQLGIQQKPIQITIQSIKSVRVGGGAFSVLTPKHTMHLTFPYSKTHKRPNGNNGRGHCLSSSIHTGKTIKRDDLEGSRPTERRSPQVD